MSWARASLAFVHTVVIGVLLLGPFIVLSQAMPTEVFDASSWRHLLSDPLLQASILRSVMVALLSTVLATLVAVVIALGITRNSGWQAGFLLMAALLPLAMPPFLLAATLQAGLGENTTLGSLLNAWGHLPLLVITYAVHFAPVVLLGITLGLRRVDPELAESARCHGVNNTATWLRIVMPVLVPSTGLALVVVMIRILGDAGAPLALGAGGLLAAQLLAAPTDGDLSVRGLQMAWLLTFMNAVLVATVWRYLAVPPPAATHRPRRNRSGHLGLWLIGAVMCVITGIPVVWLAGQFDWQTVMGLPARTLGLVGAINWQTALASAAAFAVIGLPTVILTQRGVRFSPLLRAIVALSLIPSTVVIGMAFQLASADPFFTTPRSNAWPMLFASLAVTLPLIALLPQLGARFDLHSTGEASNLARCFGANPAWLGFRLGLPKGLALTASLLCFGAALSLSDMSTNAFLAADRTTWAALLFENIRGGAIIEQWAMPGLGLTLAGFVLLVFGGLLLTGRFGLAGFINPPRQ